MSSILLVNVYDNYVMSINRIEEDQMMTIFYKRYVGVEEDIDAKQLIEKYKNEGFLVIYTNNGVASLTPIEDGQYK